MMYGFFVQFSNGMPVIGCFPKAGTQCAGIFAARGFGKELGDFSDFTRARKRLNLPVVLTRKECQGLFAALDGTMRLMAELM